SLRSRMDVLIGKVPCDQEEKSQISKAGTSQLAVELLHILRSIEIAEGEAKRRNVQLPRWTERTRIEKLCNGVMQQFGIENIFIAVPIDMDHYDGLRQYSHVTKASITSAVSESLTDWLHCTAQTRIKSILKKVNIPDNLISIDSFLVVSNRLQ